MPSHDASLDDAFTKALARIITARKDESTHSIRSLASATGLAFSTVRNYLDGSREIPVPALRKLAAALGANASDLLDEAERSLD